jgi:tetratricopeptide (TPR) repeat protein
VTIRHGRRAPAALVVALFAAACGGGAPATTSTTAPPAASSASPADGLRPVTLPDLTRVDASVQQQMVEREGAIKATLARPGATNAEKAAAFGGLAVLLHAAEYYEAAEPAYLNAQELAPDDARWPHLLHYLHKSRGAPDKAIADLTRVLELAPDDVPALIWLGRLYLDQGQADKAEPLFERAQRNAPGTVAALLGLGQSALARKDYKQAVTVLEEALRVNPAATSLHSPLAMAYRGLGDTARASSHLRQWRNTEVLVADPVRLELDLSLQSGLSFELRGVRALEARDFKAAEGFFREGVKLTDGRTMLGRSLRHKLGTALFFLGDLPGAVAQFRDTVRLAPATGRDETAAKAHYSLGVLMASAGLGSQAIEHLTSAAAYNPNYVEALQALADALRRQGRVADSMKRYQEALQVNPRSAEARVGYGMALVRLRKYREARTWFEETLATRPDVLDAKQALARLLAAAPDEQVRDGARGLGLVQQIMSAAPDRTTALWETFAMALAETGDFTQAASAQRDVLAAVAKAGSAGDVRRVTRNLRLYEQRRPCREPWADDDPAHAPGPPIDPALRAVLRADRS